MTNPRTLGGWPLLAAGLCLCLCLRLVIGEEAPLKEAPAKAEAAKNGTAQEAPEKDATPKKPVKKENAIKFKALLIWGTDLEKPADSKDKKIKDLDPKFKEKLCRLFKWKNYYQVDLQTIVVPINGSQITCMSHDCMVEIFHHGQTNVEVHLYGENILVQKLRKDLCKGEYLSIGGNVKNKENEAWIVSVCLAE